MKSEIALAREVGRAFAEIGGRPPDPLVDELARAILDLVAGSGGSNPGPKRHLRGPKSREQAVLKLKNRV